MYHLIWISQDRGCVAGERDTERLNSSSSQLILILFSTSVSSTAVLLHLFYSIFFFFLLTQVPFCPPLFNQHTYVREQQLALLFHEEAVKVCTKSSAQLSVSGWTLLGSAGLCWSLLGSAGLCWALLQALLGSAAGSTGLCWALLGSAGPCWALLGSAGLCCRIC